MTMTYEPLKAHTGCSCGTGGGCGCGGGTGCCGSCTWTGDTALYGLERTRFYPRQIVTPDDLTQDQIYFRDKMRRHNRLLHGWGLVCGLLVERCGGPDEASLDPCRVRITSGYALDPYGNEIVVPDNQVVDLCKEDLTGALACLPHDDPWCRPIEAPRNDTYYLAVRFRERAIKPVHAPTGCSCKDTSCENSRFRDGYEFTLLTDLPNHYAEPCDPYFDPCAGVDCCPPCPTSGWVIVGTIDMDNSKIAAILNEYRRHLVSLSGYCLDCSKEGWRPKKRAKFGKARRLFASASAAPDTFIKMPVVIDGDWSELVIAVANSDLAGKPVATLANDWSAVSVFDTDDPLTPLFNASWVLAHSPMKGTWVVESADDLKARLGTPVIDTVTYPVRRMAIETLLDPQGRTFFHDVLLDNTDRLDEIEVMQIAGISANAKKALTDAGVHFLDDLRTFNVEDSSIATATKPKLIEIRKAISWA